MLGGEQPHGELPETFGRRLGPREKRERDQRVGGKEVERYPAITGMPFDFRQHPLSQSGERFGGTGIECYLGEMVEQPIAQRGRGAGGPALEPGIPGSSGPGLTAHRSPAPVEPAIHE